MSCNAPEAGTLDYCDYVNRLSRQDAVLAGELADFRSVEKVLQWMQVKGLGRTEVDLIGQDEFSYDFLLQLETAGRWLAFAVT